MVCEVWRSKNLASFFFALCTSCARIPFQGQKLTRVDNLIRPQNQFLRLHPATVAKPAKLRRPALPWRDSRFASPVPPARPREQGSRTRARVQAQAQGCGEGAAGPEHGAGHGPRSASRPPLPMPPCPTRYAAPPAGATTSALDLALPAPHAPAQPPPPLPASCLAATPTLPSLPCW